jgi:putative sigma-54 modulation protein
VELQIRSNGTKVTQGMREFIDRRMAKLDRLADHVVDAQLELRTEHSRTGSEFTTAQLTLQTGRHVLRAEERDAEPARAIDAAIDKLIKQVRKYNDKRTNRKRRIPTSELTATSLPIGDEAADLSLPADLSFSQAAIRATETMDEGPIVRTKRFSMKPMHVEEAIDQMELVGHDFFFFQNADDDQLSVLYRRRDGSYGILQPG